MAGYADDPVNYCACGEPIHYQNPRNRDRLMTYVAEVGPFVKVIVGGRAWLVQRHYIALHGLKAQTIESEAKRLGFQEIEP